MGDLKAKAEEIRKRIAAASPEAEKLVTGEALDKANALLGKPPASSQSP